MYTGKHRAARDNSSAITIFWWSSESRKGDSNHGAKIEVLL